MSNLPFQWHLNENILYYIIPIILSLIEYFVRAGVEYCYRDVMIYEYRCFVKNEWLKKYLFDLTGLVVYNIDVFYL